MQTQKQYIRQKQSFYYTGSVFVIIVILKNKAVVNQLFSKWFWMLVQTLTIFFVLIIP